MAGAGWSSPLMFLPLAAGLAVLALLIVTGLVAPEPLLPVRPLLHLSRALDMAPAQVGLVLLPDLADLAVAAAAFAFLLRTRLSFFRLHRPDAGPVRAARSPCLGRARSLLDRRPGQRDHAACDGDAVPRLTGAASSPGARELSGGGRAGDRTR
jgi:hypothetical protein